MTGAVVAVSLSPRHRFSKDVVDAIELLEGCGVVGDAHAGATGSSSCRRASRSR